MKLPHGELLLFAKEVTKRTEDSIEIHCVFTMLPRLAMFIEAAAQCSAGFDLDDNIELGFLTMAKNIHLLETIKENEYLFTLHKEALVGEYSQYSFEAVALKSKVKVVKGSFTVMIKEKEKELELE